VDDAGAVGGVHGVGDPLDQFGGLQSRHWGPGRLRRQTAAAAEFQGQERHRLGARGGPPLADLERLHDVGVPQPDHRLGLGPEPLAGRCPGSSSATVRLRPSWRAR
jgi:hypothetical protein